VTHAAHVHGVHCGETPPAWATERIEDILAMPQAPATAMPDPFVRLIRRLLDWGEIVDDDAKRTQARAALNFCQARRARCLCRCSLSFGGNLHYSPFFDELAQGPDGRSVTRVAIGTSRIRIGSPSAPIPLRLI
jgi:hypothetical protein